MWIVVRYRTKNQTGQNQRREKSDDLESDVVYPSQRPRVRSERSDHTMLAWPTTTCHDMALSVMSMKIEGRHGGV